MTNRLYVGNLSFNTSDDELRNAFAGAGEVSEARVITDRETGRSRGFGFVTMRDEAAAKAAISQLDGSSLDNRSLKVREAEERPSGGGGGGGRSGGGGGGGGYSRGGW
jgi:cold-inducible RNA-binding protein